MFQDFRKTFSCERVDSPVSHTVVYDVTVTRFVFPSREFLQE